MNNYARIVSAPPTVWIVVITSLGSAACSTSNGAQANSRWLRPEAEYFKPAVRVYFDTGKDDDDELDVFQDGALNASVDFLGVSLPFLALKGKEDAEVQHIKAVENAKWERLNDRAMTKQAEARLARLTSIQSQKAGTDPEQADRDATRAEDEARMAEFEAKEQARHLKRIEKKAGREDGTRLAGDWVLGPRLAVGLTSPAGNSESGEEASGAPVVYVSASLFADFQKGGQLDEDDDGVGVRLEIGYMRGMSADESISNADDSAIFVGMTVSL
jgi:hypothetical protein